MGESVNSKELILFMGEIILEKPLFQGYLGR